jgi:TPR repeat protein
MNILDSFFGAGAFQEDAAPAPYVAPLERRDYAAAVPLLKAAMNKEDARAMGLFAALSALGRGVEKNPEDACAWFRQAANRDHVPSQAALGMCLAGGLGAPVDRKEASYWLYRAGKAGNMQAIEVLGALAYKDNSIVGVHFTEDELCKLVMQLRKLVTQNTVAPTVSSQLH